MIQIGEKFPEFSLLDQNGRRVGNKELMGNRVVIYFYPKDDTPGCTKESCDFRDVITDNRSVQIIGVSPDDVNSHKKFSDKYSLNFTLLCDTDHTLAELCGIWKEKSMFGKRYMGIERTTYQLDENGYVVQIWNNVNVNGHVSDVLSSITSS